MKIDGDALVFVPQPLGQLIRERLIEPVLQDCPFVERQLLVEVFTHGIGFGGPRQVLAPALDRLTTGGHPEQDIIEMAAFAFVAVGVKRQVALDHGASGAQGLRIRQSWCSLHLGLVRLVMVRWCEPSIQAGQALRFVPTASTQIRIY